MPIRHRMAEHRYSDNPKVKLNIRKIPLGYNGVIPRAFVTSKEFSVSIAGL